MTRNGQGYISGAIAQPTTKLTWSDAIRKRVRAPVRVVDPPLHPNETAGPNPKPCTWTIYKSVDAVPEEAYERIGRSKPTQRPSVGDTAG